VFSTLHSLSSTALFELFPSVARFRRFLHFDEEMAAAERERAMRLYAAMVRRHLFHVGPHKHFLSKNPLFTGKIESLRSVFPDARFINLLRDPVHTLPSAASLLHHVWHRSGTLPAQARDPDLVVEQCGYFMRRARLVLADLPPGHARDLMFRDLVGDPDASIRAVLTDLGLPVSDAMTHLLPVEAARGRKFKSKHRYSAEDWGFTDQDIYEALADLYAVYGWPVPEGVQSQVA